MQITASFGLGNATPVFGMVPVRARALVPTITEEDRVILNNVEKVVKFLTSGTATPAMNGVCILISAL
jgi:aarF domain-containing kinase